MNGVQVTAPAAANDINFKNVGCTVNDTKADDNGKLAVPVWVEICDVAIQEGENTIVLTVIDTNYSYFICGAGLYK